MNRSLPADLGFVRRSSDLSSVRARGHAPILRTAQSDTPLPSPPAKSTPVASPPAELEKNDVSDFRSLFIAQMDKAKLAQENKDNEIANRIDRLSLLCSTLENMQTTQSNSIDSMRSDLSSISQNSGGPLIDRVKSIGEQMQVLENSFSTFSSEIRREVENIKRFAERNPQSDNLPLEDHDALMLKMDEKNKETIANSIETVTQSIVDATLKNNFKLHAICLTENIGKKPGDYIYLNHPITKVGEVTYMKLVQRGSNAEILIDSFPVEDSSGPLVKFID